MEWILDVLKSVGEDVLAYFVIKVIEKFLADEDER